MNTNNEKQAVEKISAYIDDALNVEEIESLIGVNESVERSEEHFSVAARYHMVGDALRGELSDASMVDVSAQIHLALRNESFDKIESAKPVKKSSLFETLSVWLESFARPLAGMAVAASVAVLMVVTVVQIESPEGIQQLAASPAALPSATPDMPVVNQVQQMAEFDSYLTEHAEFAAQDTLQGRIPYVRAVSYEAE